ncbi:hypothetical protein EMCRGX_G020244 [Ephydatia muelleri]|eukprot:Em0016g177a
MFTYRLRQVRIRFDSDCNLQTKSDLSPFGGVSGSVKMSELRNKEVNNDPETLSQFLCSRMGNLGLNDEVRQDQLVSRCQQAFVLVNPPKKLELKPTDLILVLKPVPSSHDDIMPVDIIGQPGSDGANLVWGQNIRTTNV